MANIKSEIKRVDVRERNRQVNNARKNETRTAIKKVETLVEAGNKVGAEAALKEAVSLLDRNSQLGTITVNSANRKKAHLTKLVAEMK